MNVMREPPSTKKQIYASAEGASERIFLDFSVACGNLFMLVQQAFFKDAQTRRWFQNAPEPDSHYRVLWPSAQFEGRYRRA